MKILSGTILYKTKFITSMIVFGSIGIFVHFIPLPAGIIAFSRGLIGGLFLTAFALVKKGRISFYDIRKNFFILCLSGAFMGINWMLLFEAYKYTTVATATLCYYLEPVFVIIASPIIFKEKITLPKVFCILAALIGMVFVSGILKVNSSGSKNAVGIILGLSAAMFYAGVIICNKKLKPISPYDQTIVQLFTAALILIPYILLTSKKVEIILDSKTVILLLIIGIVHTGITYALYFGSMVNLNAQTVAVFSYIDAVVAIFLSALILKEKITLMTSVGAVLVIGSMVLSEVCDSLPIKNRGAKIYDK